MKINYIWLMGILLASATATAQTKPAKTAYNDDVHNSYDHINITNGKRLEHIQMEWKNKTYKMELVDNKMTELYVNGEKIPSADWSKYSDAIAAIKKQIRQNQEQAKRNQEQAVRNEIQAKKNEEQAKRNEEQHARNDEQAKRNEEQAARNEEQAKLNEAQVKVNEEQAKRNEEQAAENERFVKE